MTNFINALDEAHRIKLILIVFLIFFIISYIGLCSLQCIRKSLRKKMKIDYLKEQNEYKTYRRGTDKYSKHLANNDAVENTRRRSSIKSQQIPNANKSILRLRENESPPNIYDSIDDRQSRTSCNRGSSMSRKSVTFVLKNDVKLIARNRNNT